MKKILVPSQYLKDSNPYSPARYSVREGYIKHLVKYGLLPVVVPLALTQAQVDFLYSECSGVLFLGGADISARVYGEENHKLNDCTSEPGRDHLESYLFRKIFQDRKSTLAICRGCQMMAVASGGSLHQHLPDLKLNEEHAPPPTREHLVYDACSHSVVLEKGSRLHEIVGKDVIQTNSYHHQAIKTLGPDFRIVGRSPAGVVEAIEHKSPEFFCIGLQSHPEVTDESDLEPVFKAFAEAV